MNASSIRRWIPDAVITRRKRLFWLLPLLGLISGIAFCFAPLLQWRTAAGSVQIRPQSLPGGSTPLFTPTEFADALSSDKVLEQTALALKLADGQQGESEDLVARLRTKILCRQIPGTDIVELSVKGGDRPDADRIWHGLISSANEHFRIRQAELMESELAAVTVEIENKKAELEAKSEVLQRLLRSRSRDNYDNPLDLRGPRPDLIKLVRHLTEAQQILGKLEVAVISGRMSRQLIEDPVFIHESPSARAALFFSGMLRSLIFVSTLGVAAGMLLALILAYLLELLFPRNAPTI